tara:strand:- start:39 stop:623 length:585 start_codon:yes stop_codon:yes gene_type:complete
MNIKELAKKYGLIEGDFWNHKQSGQWILTHDAVEKIATIEGIMLVNIETLNSEKDLVRFLITMAKGDVTITSVGEADDKNCFSGYKGCMAEKRGVDRCVLKLINAYEYGISSEVEADDFKKPQQDYKYIKTDNELEKFIKYKDDDNFKIYLKDNSKTITEINDKWDKCNSKSTTHVFLNQMETEIENYKEQEVA